MPTQSSLTTSRGSPPPCQSPCLADVGSASAHGTGPHAAPSRTPAANRGADPGRSLGAQPRQAGTPGPAAGRGRRLQGESRQYCPGRPSSCSLRGELLPPRAYRAGLCAPAAGQPLAWGEGCGPRGSWATGDNRWRVMGTRVSAVGFQRAVHACPARRANSRSRETKK